MSDTAQGHGWWQATDGRWYPPESHPNYTPTLPRQATAVLPPPAQSYAQFTQPVVASPRKRKKALWKRWWFILLVLLIAAFVIIGVTSPTEDETPAAVTQPVTVDSIAPEAQDAISETPPANPVVAEPAPESNLTPSQQNAVRSAQSYLDLMGFSRQGLIKQLEFEQYPTSDATVAVDTLSVDWNSEAAESAQAYLDTMAFSCQGLIDQLEFEGYTPSQAQHGATQAGIC